MALMLVLAPGRERIVLPEDGYYGGRVLADRLRPHSTRPVPVDLRDLAAVERALAGGPSVHYPGIDGPDVDKATSELARRQMPDGFGPLLSVGVEPAADLITDIDQALGVL
jgi:cystathionine beta-lyase/cystathionine gamma-synthase